MILALLFTASCHKEKEDDTSNTLLFGYLLDQTSGNCAKITKNTAGTVFTASGSKIPKGGCNAATLNTALYTTSPATAKAAVDTFYDNIKAVYDRHSSCTSLGTAFVAAKTQVTEATITTTQNALMSGNTGCANVGTYSYRISGNKWSSVFICKDEASITAVKALSDYLPITSASSDMVTSLTSKRSSLTLLKTTNGFTDAQILTLEPDGVTEATAVSSINYLAYAFSSSVSACAKQVVESDTLLKAFIASTSGLATAFGVNQADVDAVTTLKTNPLAPVQCGYGTGFSATTTIGACPVGYSSF